MIHSEGHIVLLAPFTGPVVPLANVPDPVFSDGMFGDGIGIDPLEGRLVAPCDGTVTHLARTGHAVTLAHRRGRRDSAAYRYRHGRAERQGLCADGRAGRSTCAPARC